MAAGNQLDEIRFDARWPAEMKYNVIHATATAHSVIHTRKQGQHQEPQHARLLAGLVTDLWTELVAKRQGQAIPVTQSAASEFQYVELCSQTSDSTFREIGFEVLADRAVIRHYREHSDRETHVRKVESGKQARVHVTIHINGSAAQ